MLQQSNTLVVWVGNMRAATLQLDDHGRFRLEYAPTWSTSRAGYPFSPTLPLAGSTDSPEVHSAKVRFFFENLLPEGRSLDEAVLANGLSKANVFGLLHALGRESAGSLMMLAPDNYPQALMEGDIPREIPLSELSERINAMPHVPFSVWDGKVRMSVAGYQSKLAVRRTEDGRLWLSNGLQASTHILKPQMSGNDDHQVANEYFCMRLAAQAGVESATVDILRVPEPILMVKRFDRLVHSEGSRRLHIIDACQALNKSPDQKYERNLGSGEHVRHIREGISLKALFSIAHFAVNKADMTLRQLRWLLLQYLIGNTDAHGKNMSFFVSRDGLRLAPAYDQLSVTIYPTINHEFAMSIGGEFTEEAIRGCQWAEFAIECGLDPKMVARTMITVANKARDALPTLLRDSALEENERGFLRRLSDQIHARADQLVDVARHLPQLARTLNDAPPADDDALSEIDAAPVAR